MHDKNFEKMIIQGGIWALDHTESDKMSFQPISLITRDVGLGLQNADIVLIMTQSLQHDAIASLISPYITDSIKMILVISGNLGSVLFKNKLSNKNLIIGEGESSPYDARIIEPRVVNILFKNIRNKLGFLPSSVSKQGIQNAKNIIDTYDTFRTNVIESALHNPNLVVHTIGVIMSAARIEYSKGEFYMYREAFTESVWNIVDALDIEKNAVI